MGFSVFGGGLVAEAGLPSHVVVLVVPVDEFDACVQERGEGVDVEELIALACVERFDVPVFPWFTRCYERQVHDPCGPLGKGAAVAPQDHSILGLISVVAPNIATGNACIVMPSPSRPIPTIALAECLVTSDVPCGVVNIFTGAPAEVMPWLAEHADVNALELTGIVDSSVAADLERQAAGTAKRIRPPKPGAA